MSDIQNPKILYLKGALMLATGLLASTLLLFESPTLHTAILLGVAIWGFTRAYYFAFYVIEHYIDPSFRFASLTAFARYAWKQRKAKTSDSLPQQSHPQSTIEPKNRSIEH
jgi:hypothetical protein